MCVSVCVRVCNPPRDPPSLSPRTKKMDDVVGRLLTVLLLAASSSSGMFPTSRDQYSSPGLVLFCSLSLSRSPIPIHFVPSFPSPFIRFKGPIFFSKESHQLEFDGINVALPFITTRLVLNKCAIYANEYCN